MCLFTENPYVTANNVTSCEAFLYEWYDTATGKRYAGIHNGRNGYRYAGSGVEFKKAFNERPTDFHRTIIAHHPDYEEIKKMEVAYLKKHNAAESDEWYNLCYNVPNMAGKKFSDGHRANISTSLTGKIRSDETRAKISRLQKGRVLSDEHRAKISVSNTGRVVSDETKEKISIAQRGKRNHFYGSTHTEEARKAISERHKGVPLSDEHKEKIGAASRGRKHSTETRAKISRLQKGRRLTEEWKRNIGNAMRGKVVSDEQKRKTSKSLMGRSHNKTPCPHCGKEVSNAMMKRWHGDNCKMKP